MLKEVLTWMLEPRHIEAGMSVEDDEDFVYLMWHSNIQEKFNAREVKPLTIRNTADLALAGVEIKQVIDKCEHIERR